MSDVSLHDPYEEYGMQGLKAGMELGQKYKTPEEMRKEFERVRSRDAQRKVRLRNRLL